MLTRTLLVTCLFIYQTGNAQTGRYWVLAENQSIHFIPNPIKTNRFITAYQKQLCHDIEYYYKCKYLSVLSFSNYSDCDDSLYFYVAFDSAFSYTRKPIGQMGIPNGPVHPGNSSILLPIPQKKDLYAFIGPVSGAPSTIYNQQMVFYEIYYNRNTDTGYINPNKRKIYLKTKEVEYDPVWNPNQTSNNLSWTPHADGVNFWVLTLKDDSTFQAYPLDSSGVVISPVESKVKGNFAEGNIRPSHDFKHIVVSGVRPIHSKTYSTWLYDFDISTGKLSNGRGIVKHIEHYKTLSKAVEFSPKDSFIYISSHTDTLIFKPRLLQHNVNTGKNIELATFPNFKSDNQWRLFSLQLAPDGKIYGS